MARPALLFYQHKSWMFAMTRSPMIVRCRLGLPGLVVALAWGCAPAQAEQFLADLAMVRTEGGAVSPAGKLRVFDNKVRIEVPDFAGGFFLIDGAKPTAYFARPADRTFMDARQSSRLTRLFVRVDPADPCRQWQTMAELAGVAVQDPWRCERIGQETIAGRDTIAFRARLPDDREMVGWIDPDLQFPLRIRSEDGITVTAENIRNEPQAATLFEIPSNFRKFDPQELIKRIKQSDVWVDEPK
jgi:hypothetical protein